MSFSKNKILKYQVNENEVFEVLGQHILADGFNLVLDLEKSSGDIMFDKRTGKKYYDFFTGFASMPIGWNHPKLNNKEFIEFIDPLIDDAQNLEPAELINLIRVSLDIDRYVTDEDMPSPDDVKLDNLNQLQLL